MLGRLSKIIFYSQFFKLFVLIQLPKKRNCVTLRVILTLNMFNCSPRQPTEDFVNTCYAYGLCQLIDKPTRITPNTATLIDNILTNTNNSDISTGILYADIIENFHPLSNYQELFSKTTLSSEDIYYQEHH